MNLLEGLAIGFSAALSGEALLFCFVGVSIGMFVGVLPGIGALAAVSMILPVTFHLEPMSAIIMLAGIFYGSQYGGSIASILLNLPGTAPNAVTCLDGYPMTRQGRAGVALFITTITSFVGSTLAILLLMGFAPVLGQFALRFSSAEYFSMMLLGLVAASALSIGSPLKGLVAVVAGLVLGLVGMDVNSGQDRFTFGIVELFDGLNLIAVAMGLFGVAEILANIGNRRTTVIDPRSITIKSLIPTRQDMRLAWKPALRGSAIGSFVGILPGAGPSIAAFMSYALEKKISRTPARFGRGAVEGISAPEAANNASVQAAFIPTLTLGIPGDATMAILLAAMMIHGILPQPEFFSTQPQLFWGLVVSFWIGNLILLILNIPLIGLWVRILTIPYHYLFIGILFFICVGVYSVNNNPFDVLIVIIFGVIGYFMLIYQYPAAPLLMGFILGPMMEEHFRRALLFSRGDLATFVERPISGAFLAAALLVLVASLVPIARAALRRRAEAGGMDARSPE